MKGEKRTRRSKVFARRRERDSPLLKFLIQREPDSFRLSLSAPPQEVNQQHICLNGYGWPPRPPRARPRVHAHQRLRYLVEYGAVCADFFKKIRKKIKNIYDKFADSKKSSIFAP